MVEAHGFLWQLKGGLKILDSSEEKKFQSTGISEHRETKKPFRIVSEGLISQQRAEMTEVNLPFFGGEEVSVLFSSQGFSMQL